MDEDAICHQLTARRDLSTDRLDEFHSIDPARFSQRDSLSMGAYVHARDDGNGGKFSILCNRIKDVYIMSMDDKQCFQ